MHKEGTYVLILWMIALCLLLINIQKSDFFNIGPSNDLCFLGMKINTIHKYILFCLFCFMNSLMRKINNVILYPWVTLNVQDEEKIKPQSMHFDAYLTSNISNLFVWIDWIIYMNILLTQIDFILVEMIADFICLNYLTYKYLKNDGYQIIK